MSELYEAYKKLVEDIKQKWLGEYKILIEQLIDENEDYSNKLTTLQIELDSLKDMEFQADIEHEIWSSWMRYMFTCGTFNDDGTWTMPADKVERWQLQMDTAYSELTEREKESDREQVRKHWGMK